MLPTQSYVSELVEHFMDGTIAIPEIQRDVVWKPDQVMINAQRKTNNTNMKRIPYIGLVLVSAILAGCGTSPARTASASRKARAAAADYGPYPANYQQLIADEIAGHIVSVSTPYKALGRTPELTGWQVTVTTSDTSTGPSTRITLTMTDYVVIRDGSVVYVGDNLHRKMKQ